MNVPSIVPLELLIMINVAAITSSIVAIFVTFITHRQKIEIETAHSITDSFFTTEALKARNAISDVISDNAISSFEELKSFIDNSENKDELTEQLGFIVNLCERIVACALIGGYSQNYIRNVLGIKMAFWRVALFNKKMLPSRDSQWYPVMRRLTNEIPRLCNTTSIRLFSEQRATATKAAA